VVKTAIFGVTWLLLDVLTIPMRCAYLTVVTGQLCAA